LRSAIIALALIAVDLAHHLIEAIEQRVLSIRLHPQIPTAKTQHLSRKAFIERLLRHAILLFATCYEIFLRQLFQPFDPIDVGRMRFGVWTENNFSSVANLSDPDR
jgi:hypothetical protein